jgi:hypothetical protein
VLGRGGGGEATGAAVLGDKVQGAAKCAAERMF